MDTWEWYNKYSQELRDAGQEYIPQLIDDFSESVLHLQIEKCDSLLPEMKALNQVAKIRGWKYLSVTGRCVIA